MEPEVLDENSFRVSPEFAAASEEEEEEEGTGLPWDLLGLLGVAGLAGLAGIRRARSEAVIQFDARRNARP
jgi:MYXO-CTERM domain-containing protein